jgi:hypothetical protein
MTRTRVRSPLAFALVAVCLAALPATASAVSVVHITSPPDGKTYYTGSSATARVEASAELSSDCDAGLWYLRRNPPGGPYGPYDTGGLLTKNLLMSTDNLLPGDYEYSGSVTCVSQAGDTYTTDFHTIHVVSGFAPPPPDNTAPAATLSGKTSLKLGTSLTVGLGCNEACKATATGTVSIRHSSKSYKLKKATTSIAAGRKGKLKLGVPGSVRKAVLKALKGGKSASAKLTILVKDAAGNRTTKKRTIKLKR